MKNGGCEAMIQLYNGTWTRCWRKPTESHHMLTRARGGRILDEVGETYHLINRDTLAQMKPGAYLINVSRGALIDTPALIDALKSGHVGAAGLDVYEEEARLFFEDRRSGARDWRTS